MPRVTVIDGEFVSARAHATPANAVVTEEEVREALTVKQQLEDLEKAAREQGMDQKTFDAIRLIGNCKAQQQTRARKLNEWLAAH